MFIAFYLFPFFSFAFPIPLNFPFCFLPNQMHHSLLFWLSFPRAESQQFCLSGHFCSPELSPRVWGAKLRKVTFLGSLCSQLEDMGASRRWLRFWGCHKTLWRLMSSHELPVRLTNILTYKLWIGDPILFSTNPAFAEFSTCQMDEKHKSGDLPSNQHCPPRCQIPAHSLAVRRSGIYSTAADRALQQLSYTPESHLCFRQSIWSNFKKPSKNFCSGSFFCFKISIVQGIRK